MPNPAEGIPVLPPKEALDFFRRKGLTVGFAWQDVWQEEHVRAFTVAKAMSRDLLEDIRAAVDTAIADGSTLDTFRRDLKPLLEKRGWWGRRSMVDPLTGEQKIVQLGSPRRLKTIFEVNMRTSYAAGRWERAQRSSKAFPFLRYVTAGDSKVRPQHRAWDGVIRPINDGFWDTHYPPCGWSCRCTAVPVSNSMIERRGWNVTDEPPSFPLEPYTNPRTGEVTRIEKGIDPGFNYNVGRAYMETLSPRPIGPGGEGRDIAADRSGAGVRDLADDFLGAFGIDAKAPEPELGQIHIDQGGWPLAISLAWFRRLDGKLEVAGAAPGDDASRRALLGRVGKAIAEPDEIRWAWVRGLDETASLVRRYIGGGGSETVIVEVGRAGWRYVTAGDHGFAAVRSAGTVAWPRD